MPGRPADTPRQPRQLEGAGSPDRSPNQALSRPALQVPVLWHFRRTHACRYALLAFFDGTIGVRGTRGPAPFRSGRAGWITLHSRPAGAGLHHTWQRAWRGPWVPPAISATTWRCVRDKLTSFRIHSFAGKREACPPKKTLAAGGRGGGGWERESGVIARGPAPREWTGRAGHAGPPLLDTASVTAFAGGGTCSLPGAQTRGGGVQTRGTDRRPWRRRR